MTHDIIVFGVNANKPFKVNAIKWKRSVEDFSDSCVIKMPAITRLTKHGDIYERIQTGLLFKEGMKVEVTAGYDGENDLQFKGFISRINFSIPLELECEGYSYQLRRKLDFTKAYKSTTVKKILTDATNGTDIKLSSEIPDIPIDKVSFNNVSGIQILEWLKEKCLLAVYFNHDILYVGGLELEPKETKEFRLNWNTVKDSELKFGVKEFTAIRIEITKRTENGKKLKAGAGKKDGQTKKLKTYLKDESILKQIAERERTKLVNKGYEGSITAFLKPYIEPGMAIYIDDAKYPERKGRYFISAVEGEFSSNGGRQKLVISNSL
jgi:phage protein D